MADPVFIVEHWKEQQKIFLANLVLLKHKPDTDPVHDWRVAVKKLRSYLKLFFLILGKKYDKDRLAATQKLFRIMGKLRDISMSQAQLTDKVKKDNELYPSLRVYFDYVFSEAEKRTNHSLQLYDAAELQKTGELIAVDLSTISDEEMQHRTMDIIYRQIKKITAQLKTISKKNAHLLRKLMKDLLYWVSICPFPTPVGQDSLKKLSKITDWLGTWQDQQIFLLHIRHFRNDLLAKGADEYSFYTRLEKNIKKKKRESLQKAEIAAKDFFSTVHS
jgi:CHAD domain-containing protein